MNIPFFKMQSVYMLRVVYKSGFVQDFKATEFSISKSRVEWTNAGGVKPLMLGLDEIAAVWQIGVRKRIAR